MINKIKYSRLYYPGYFGIKEKSFYKIYDGKEFLGIITLLNHHSALEMIDLNSKLNLYQNNNKTSYKYSIPIPKTSKGALIDFKSLERVNFNLEKYLPEHDLDDLAIVLENLPLPRVIKKVHYTELLISREFREEENENESSKELDMLEIFISKYRELTNDINIKNPKYFNWNTFGLISKLIVDVNPKDGQYKIEDLLLKEIKLENLKTNQIQFDIREFRKVSKPTFDISKITGKLSKKLIEGLKPNSLSDLTNKINEEIYIYDKFKFALLESFIFCESYISNYLREKKIEKGISKKKMDEMEVTFSYLLNIELPLFISDYNQEWKGIIGNVNWVRKKRNNVVHNGEDVTKDEAIRAINSIKTLILYIKAASRVSQGNFTPNFSQNRT